MKSSIWESPWTALVIVAIAFAIIAIAALDEYHQRTHGDGFKRRPSALEEYQRVWRGV